MTVTLLVIIIIIIIIIIIHTYIAPWSPKIQTRSVVLG